MSDRIIPGSGYDSETRNRILDVTTELFALKGFDAVSMRDIAKAVKLKTSSIYYYYDGKEALLEDIFVRVEYGYRHYFDWLTELNVRAESLEELMDNMFNKEFVEMLNPIGCLGISLLVKEQHNNQSARKRVFDVLYEHSIQRMQADFDRLIDLGIIPPSDTKTIATIFMFCVLIGTDIAIHEYKGMDPPIDSKTMYEGLKTMLTWILRQGGPGVIETQKTGK